MQNNPYGVDALWQQGDLIIKFVAVMLLLMSIASWTVIVVRAIGLWQRRRELRKIAAFWHAQNFNQGLDSLGSDTGNNPFRNLAQEGRTAFEHHQSHQQDLHGLLPIADWLTESLRGAIDQSTERLQRGLSILASVGSTSPFIGLFGTVWGIYHALIGIGVSGQASIDKVAGPVGEALIMTAFGLAVAIPAVLAYNAISRANRLIVARLNRFALQLHAYLLTGVTPAREQKRASANNRSNNKSVNKNSAMTEREAG